PFSSPSRSFRNRQAKSGAEDRHRNKIRSRPAARLRIGLPARSLKSPWQVRAMPNDEAVRYRSSSRAVLTFCGHQTFLLRDSSTLLGMTKDRRRKYVGCRMTEPFNIGHRRTLLQIFAFV